MRIVIDGLPIRGDNSLSIVSEHLLSGWQQRDRDDELHLVLRAGAGLAVPDSVTVHEVTFGRLPFVSRLRAQSFTLPRLCRSLQADVLLGVLPTTAVTRLPCPRAVIAWDFRYRLRPEQFSRKTLVLRRASYAVGFRQADGIACISGRTRRDLLAFHPKVAKVPVRVAHLGADHVDIWPTAAGGAAPYAIAFGHFSNKNVDLVVQAWAALQRDTAGPILPLRVVGLAERDRTGLQARVEQLGLSDVVSISPWLPKEAFQEQFASASLVVFPSDFEGFGLPAVEAMRLGIPVVITPEPALLEVTGGHATVMDGEGPEALARAVEVARRTTPEAIAAATRHAAAFTWTNFATGVRGVLGEITAPAPVPVAVAAPRSRRLRTLPARLGAAVAAGFLVIGGATAVSFALGSSHPSHPGTGSSATSATGATSPVVARHGVGQRGGSGATGSRGTTGGNSSATTLPGAAGSGTGTRGSQGPSTSIPPTTPLPAVTVPSLTVPPVTVPPVTVPPVTVPTSVCSTTTTVTTPVTMPCITVSGQTCCP